MIVTLGTTNPGKVSEVAALLAPLGIDLEPLSLDVPETSTTFEGNSALKAIAYAKQSGKVTIAEDSGLVVPALDGLPGVWSARFTDLDLIRLEVNESGRDRVEIDRLNNDRVLRLMPFEPSARVASFVVIFTVADPTGTVLVQIKGECAGHIAPEARGSNGFGYDPIFIGQGTYGKTFAELDTARKNLRSHRKKALDELYAWFENNKESLS